jgi:tRNA-modifying protein YgfZ
MSELKSALLPTRGVVRISGSDAAKLLQGLVTGDMARLENDGDALHAGLLTPQGKILFDFFVVRDGDGFLLEIDGASVPGLCQRISMYKLRADAEIADVSGDYAVAVVWGDGAETVPARAGSIAFVDPRMPLLGARLLMGIANDDALQKLGADPKSEADYDAMRIALGVPEAGKDFELGQTFPHEALYDQLAGVSFKKGCFVGQEVVSRMHHRGTARSRLVPVSGEAKLPQSGSEVRAGSAPIGRLGSVSGSRAIALLRLDRASEAVARGQPLMAGKVPIRIEIPEWATFSIDGTGQGKA